MTTQLLTRAGILFDIVDNGQETLAALQGKTYDAVLMDVMMPVMDEYLTKPVEIERLHQTLAQLTAMRP